jgi:hypothetical protein
MEYREDVVSILPKLNLDDIEKTISQPYHQAGQGRPPRKPLDIFKALAVKLLREIPSDRELYTQALERRDTERSATERNMRSPDGNDDRYLQGIPKFWNLLFQ